MAGFNAATGGTGQTSYTAGDVLYASASTTLSKLAIGAANRVLTSSGSAPQWSSSLSLAGSLTAATGVTVTTGGLTVSAGTTAVQALTATTGAFSDTLAVTQDATLSARLLMGHAVTTGVGAKGIALAKGNDGGILGGLDNAGTTVHDVLALRYDATTAADYIKIGNSTHAVMLGSAASVAGAGAGNLVFPRTGGARVVDGAGTGTEAVLGYRRTGWATATGTATRTTFDTTTVTTAQLAERVKALIDDLHATAGHGLIGT